MAHLALLLALLAPTLLMGTVSSLPQEPLGIVEPNADDEEAVIVWGTVGPWERVDPRATDDDIRAFRSFLKDEVVRRALRRAAEQSVTINGMKADIALEEMARLWREAELATDLTAVMTPVVTDHAILADMTEVPYALRANLQICFVDFRDANQVTWLLRTARGWPGTSFPIIVACGWTSRAELLAFARQHPGLPIDAFGDQLAHRYGIFHLPALVTFPTAGQYRLACGWGAADDRDGHQSTHCRVVND